MSPKDQHTVGFDPENPFALPDLTGDEARRLRDHIQALAEENSLRWRESEIGWLEAEGGLGERWFETPVLRTEFHYLVALHEVGHHVLDLQTEDGDGAVLFVNEVDVWEWALNQSIIEPSPEACAQVRLTLQTYPKQRPPNEQVDRLARLTGKPDTAVDGGSNEP